MSAAVRPVHLLHVQGGNLPMAVGGGASASTCTAVTGPHVRPESRETLSVIAVRFPVVKASPFASLGLSWPGIRK